MRTINDLLTIAHAAGSTATTPAGAIKYLRAHGLPRPVPTSILSPAAARRERIQKYMARNVSWGYRQSGSAWAGGDHTIKWYIGDTPDATCGTETAWSRNGKWSGTNSHAMVKITQRAITLLGVTRLYIGGLLTLDAERISQRVYRAAWIEQSRGVSVRVARGYIVRGYHVETDDLDNALRTAGRARRKSLVQAISARATKRCTRAEEAKLTTVWISADDSARAGNCPAGTRAAESRLANFLHASGNIGAVRADVALKTLPDQAVYIRRAITAAQHREG